LLVCLIGLGIIASHTDQDTDFLGLALVLLGALSWGIGNTVSRNAGKVNMLAYVVWSSIFSVIPLIVLSLMFEGWDLIQTSLGGLNSTLWAAILWQSWGNTLFGFAAWAWLLARHPAAVVAPISLLVPVLGIGSAAIFLGEPLPLWKIAAATLVIVGLGINIYWPIIRARLKSSV
jgi:O-acetylserine/cysteine efflux transporter